jgi:hypothetical protein
MQSHPGSGAVAPLERSVSVGEISASEAGEIRALNGLIADADRELKRWQQLAVVIRSQRAQLLSRVVESKGLDMRNIYNVNDESGVIVQTHQYVVEPKTDEADSKSSSRRTPGK